MLTIASTCEETTVFYRLCTTMCIKHILIKIEIKKNQEIYLKNREFQSSRYVNAALLLYRCICPCSLQGCWNQMIFKVPSNPSHAMIL